MFKKFLIWLVKSVLMLLIVTLIFSSVTLDFPNLIKGLFGDIFAYASPDAQKQVAGKLAETCSSLNQGQGNPLTPDLSKIGNVCRDYKAGKIDDKEFFFDVIGNSLPSNAEMPQIGFFDKYNKAINYLNNNKMISFLILFALIIILYLLIMDVKLFILALTKISFSIGIIIMLPYFAILAYQKFIGFDTTPILSSLFGAGNVFDFKAIASVILLLFLKTYNNLIITTGIVLLVIGIAGKVYSWKLKKESKTTEAKTEKKSGKEESKKAKATKENKTKKGKGKEEDADEADKRRHRSAKEILDELDEMHRKKINKD